MSSVIKLLIKVKEGGECKYMSLTASSRKLKWVPRCIKVQIYKQYIDSFALVHRKDCLQIWTLICHRSWTRTILIFNKDNSQNIKSPNSLRRRLDYIALVKIMVKLGKQRFIWPRAFSQNICIFQLLSDKVKYSESKPLFKNYSYNW